MGLKCDVCGLCIVVGGMAADDSLGLVRLEPLDEDGVDELLLEGEQCSGFGSTRLVVLVEDLVDVLGARLGERVAIPDIPLLLVLELRE